MGIRGAALSSLAGYSTMFLVALFWLLRRRQVRLWECFRLSWDDLPGFLRPTNVRSQAARLLGRPDPKTHTADVLVTGIE